MIKIIVICIDRAEKISYNIRKEIYAKQKKERKGARDIAKKNRFYIENFIADAVYWRAGFHFR